MGGRRDSPATTAGTFFATPAAFRDWLRAHHRDATELVVRCYKVHAADKGITYLQAVEESLCFGWIDGITRRADADSYRVRFTPRRPRSRWSRINVQRARRLIRSGRMAAPGRAAFDARDDRHKAGYSYEERTTTLAPAYLAALRRNPEAWSYFQAQAPWYRRTSAFWVMSARREETRAKRLAVLIACSASGASIPPLTKS